MAKWSKTQREKFKQTMALKRTQGVLTAAKAKAPSPRRLRYAVRVLAYVKDQLTSTHYTVLSWGELVDLLYQQPQNALVELHLVRK